ncbi:hypothetical protein HDU96_009875 [Phlyctochytrium bullatum]|nr:hypothetical protein HDU96_009875 [Phlyctochytrium bullatum]
MRLWAVALAASCAVLAFVNILFVLPSRSPHRFNAPDETLASGNDAIPIPVDQAPIADSEYKSPFLPADGGYVPEEKHLWIPRKIHLTSKSKEDQDLQVSKGFWQERNPGFDVIVHDDEDMLRLVKEEGEKVFPGCYKLYRSFEKNVERADFWRYLIIYLHGGIYSDTDAVPQKPVDSWGEPFDQKAAKASPYYPLRVAEPKIEFEPNALQSGNNSTFIPEDSAGGAGKSDEEGSTGSEKGSRTRREPVTDPGYRRAPPRRPAPVLQGFVGAEIHLPSQAERVRQVFMFRIQWCQWTFAFRPRHPFLKMVIESIMDKAKRERAKKQAQNSPAAVLARLLRPLLRMRSESRNDGAKEVRGSTSSQEQADDSSLPSWARYSKEREEFFIPEENDSTAGVLFRTGPGLFTEVVRKWLRVHSEGVRVNTTVSLSTTPSPTASVKQPESSPTPPIPPQLPPIPLAPNARPRDLGFDFFREFLVPYGGAPPAPPSYEPDDPWWDRDAFPNDEDDIDAGRQVPYLTSGKIIDRYRVVGTVGFLPTWAFGHRHTIDQYPRDPGQVWIMHLFRGSWKGLQG